MRFRVPRWAWLAPFLIGGALRLHLALSSYGSWMPHSRTERDEGYHVAAINILDYGAVSYQLGDPTPRPFRGPLFPSFQAMLELPFARPNPDRVLLANALLSTLVIAVIGALGQRLVSPAAGLAAALMCAFDEQQLGLVRSRDIGVFYSASLTSVAAAAVLWHGRRDGLRAALLGGALAASFMCRIANFAALPLLALWGGATARPGRRVRDALLPLAATLALLSPWLVRSSLLYGSPLPEDLKAGSVRFFATAAALPCCNHSYLADEAERLEPGFRERWMGTEQGFYDGLREVGRREIRRHPARYVRALARNAWEFYEESLGGLVLGAAGAAARGGAPGGLAIALPALVATSLVGNAVMPWGPFHKEPIRPLVILSWVCGAFVLAGLALKPLDAPPQPLGWAVPALLGIFSVTYAVCVLVLARETLLHRETVKRPAGGGVRIEAAERHLAYFAEMAARDRGGESRLQRAYYLKAVARGSEACAEFAAAARLLPPGDRLRRMAESAGRGCER